MKHVHRCEVTLEAGDRIRWYTAKEHTGQDADRGEATIKAVTRKFSDESQRLMIAADDGNTYDIYGLVESACEAGGYDVVPVLVVRFGPSSNGSGGQPFA